MPSRDGVPQVVASALCRPGYGCACAAVKVDFRSLAEALIETECPSAPKEAL